MQIRPPVAPNASFASGVAGGQASATVSEEPATFVVGSGSTLNVAQHRRSLLAAVLTSLCSLRMIREPCVLTKTASGGCPTTGQVALLVNGPFVTLLSIGSPMKPAGTVLSWIL